MFKTVKSPNVADNPAIDRMNTGRGQAAGRNRRDGAG